jgi:cell wall assembly regulator SMI1
MEVKIRNSRPSITIAEIIEVESEIGLVLPEDYRNFLMLHNGGNPDPSLFPLTGDPLNPYGILRRLYCICPGDPLNLIDNYFLTKDRLPNGILPIGEDSFGNLICIGLLQNNFGKIFFWDHEEEINQINKNIYFVANSFTELLNMLVREPK